MSTTNVCPEEKRKRSAIGQDKAESIYSVATKPSATSRKLNPYIAATMPGNHNGSTHSNGTSNMPSYVTQRVLSAKTHKVKQLQNQLADAHFHLTELINENRFLRNLLKKQETALNRYENSDAELPKVLAAHAEELRVQEAKYKQVKTTNRELTQKLKETDAQLQQVSDEYKHLATLNKDKNLLEREKLQNHVEMLSEKCVKLEETKEMLQRRLELEAKNYKHQIKRELVKHRDTRNDLDLAINNADKLTNIIEMKERLLGNSTTKRNGRSPKRKSDVRPVSKTQRVPNMNKDDSLDNSLAPKEKAAPPKMEDYPINPDLKNETFVYKSTSISKRVVAEKKISPNENKELAAIIENGLPDLDLLFKEDVLFNQTASKEVDKKVQELKKDLLKKMNKEEMSSREHSARKRDDSAQHSSRSRKNSIVSFDLDTTNYHGAGDILSAPKDILKPLDMEENDVTEYKKIVQDIEGKAKAIDKHVQEFGMTKFENNEILEQLKALDEMNELVKNDSIFNLPPDSLEQLNDDFKNISKNPKLGARKKRTFEQKKVKEVFGDGDMSNKDILKDILGK